MLRSVIRSLVRDPHDAEDVLQQTLIKALQNLIYFTEPFNLGGWLSTIARNECRTFLKNRQRMVEIDPVVMAQQISAPTPATQETELVCGSLESVPPEQRRLLFMRYYTHHRHEEISRLLKLPEGTIRRRVHEAKSALKKEMTMNPKTYSPPTIRIEPVSLDKPFSIHRAGYGLMFGAPGMGLGDTEQVDVYEYPGRVYCYGAQSRVTRKAIVLGREVWEVVNTYRQRTGEKERFLYYAMTDSEISMPFRVFHYIDPDDLQIDIEPDDLASPQGLILCSDTRRETETETTLCDPVNVAIGDTLYEGCIRERSLCDDFHGACYTESFLNRQGREVLHREYIGEDWKMGGFVTFEKWRDAPETEFAGRNFRLWMEFILVAVEKGNQPD
jgi:RNA polymerase sigma-70 factor (ECF subfamily)